jgi:hypothetical protein
VASEKAKKDGVQRRKKSFNEMLRPRSSKDAKSSSPSTIDDQVPDVQHERGTSFESFGSMQDARAAGERIADLERALEVARQEQSALREELEKVRQHSQAQRDNMDDYRHQFSATYTRNPQRTSTPPRSMEIDYEPETSPRSFHRQREDLMEQNYDLRNKLAGLQEQMVEQDTLYRNKLEQAISRGQNDWNELTGRLHHSEKESQERLQQLLDLKHSISSLTRMETQATDSELAEKIDQLYHRIREWVIGNFRRTKLDLSNISSETAEALRLIHPDYTKIDHTDRLAFYQSIVASTLMRLFREPVMIGLPETGPLAHIRQLAVFIHDSGPEYREWRRTTIRALEKSEAQQSVREERDRVLRRLAVDIERQLRELTSTKLSSTAQVALVTMLRDAADLQHTLMLQKAQYQVHYYRHQADGNVIFDDNRMEPVNDVDTMDDDGDTFTERKFTFCVFPCLEKFGDEFGEKMEVRNVLLKARVCCGVG